MQSDATQLRARGMVPKQCQKWPPYPHQLVHLSVEVARQIGLGLRHHGPPEVQNWPQHRIPSTNQHPISNQSAPNQHGCQPDPTTRRVWGRARQICEIWIKILMSKSVYIAGRGPPPAVPGLPAADVGREVGGAGALRGFPLTSSRSCSSIASVVHRPRFSAMSDSSSENST